jgi:hypothetical protein
MFQRRSPVRVTECTISWYKTATAPKFHPHSWWQQHCAPWCGTHRCTKVACLLANHTPELSNVDVCAPPNREQHATSGARFAPETPSSAAATKARHPNAAQAGASSPLPRRLPDHLASGCRLVAMLQARNFWIHGAAWLRQQN